MLTCAGETPTTKSMPYNVLYTLGALVECLWYCGKLDCCCCKFPDPPLARSALVGMGRTCTVKSDKIRKELGFENVIDIRQGLLNLADCYGHSKQVLKNSYYASS